MSLQQHRKHFWFEFVWCIDKGLSIGWTKGVACGFEKHWNKRRSKIPYFMWPTRVRASPDETTRRIDVTTSSLTQNYCILIGSVVFITASATIAWCHLLTQNPWRGLESVKSQNRNSLRGDVNSQKTTPIWYHHPGFSSSGSYFLTILRVFECQEVSHFRVSWWYHGITQPAI